MNAYPTAPDFTGLNRPLGIQGRHAGLTIEGAIPADIRGAFYRAVPDPRFPPRFGDDTMLSGDGMITRMMFREDGRVDLDLRYVETARYKAEIAAGRSLFGRYRNPFTDSPEAAGLDRTVANTTPVWHAGRLLMTKEDGRAYRIDPHTLDTIGSYDFEGVLKSETMTAHVRIDPITDEMFFFGYQADGIASTKVAYCVADANGRLVREQWFDTPYCSMMHDFAITEHYALFPVYPTTASLDRLKAGGDHWIHERERESWLGVMPRYGRVAEMRWFEGPRGVSAYHLMNAFEDEDGKVHLDQCLSSTNAFPFIQAASGYHVPPHELGGGLTRWTVDPKGEGAGIAERVIGPPGDMPRIADADQGRPYVRAWYCSMNPQPQGPPLMGGAVGAMFNALLRIELNSGRIDALRLPPAHGLSEPVHVPSTTPGHEGWLITIVDAQTGEGEFTHAAWIIDAGDVEAGPVAKVHVPTRLRPQVHGWWVPAAELEDARA